MLHGDYMVTNELIESQWPRHQLNNSFTYMLEKQTSIEQKIQNKDFWKWCPNWVIQKFITICWLKFLF